MSDVVGHLVSADDRIVVRHKSGDVVTVDVGDVVSVRPLPGAPVRNPDIRRLEHAAALGWPGTEQLMLDGWLVRAGTGDTRRANSAVPVGVDADARALPAIVEFFRRRGLPARLACPDRLFRLPDGIATDGENLVMTRELTDDDAGGVEVLDAPDDAWLRGYGRDVGTGELTAVVDGVLGFGSRAGVAVGRVAVTPAPNGVLWAGLSAVHVAQEARRHGHAKALCEGLLAWGHRHGATRSYIQVLVDNAPAIALYETMGYQVHHRTRYADARDVLEYRR